MTEPTKLTPEERAENALPCKCRYSGQDVQLRPGIAGIHQIVCPAQHRGVFAEQIREAEQAARDECAELCDDMGSWRDWYYHKPKIEFLQGAGGDHAAASCYLAQLIRARKEEGG